MFDSTHIFNQARTRVCLWKSQGVIYFTSVTGMVVQDKPVFYRERASRMYATIPYAVSFLLAELPYLIINTLTFVVIFHNLLGFDDEGGDPNRLWYYWLFYLLQVLTLTSAGMLVGSLVSDVQSGLVGGMFLIHTWMLVGGFLITPNTIPNYWMWLHWASPFHYALEGLVTTQFHGVNKMIFAVTNQGLEQMTVGEYQVHHFGSKYLVSHVKYDVIVLVVMAISFQILRVFALQFFKTVKR